MKKRRVGGFTAFPTEPFVPKQLKSGAVVIWTVLPKAQGFRRLDFLPVPYELKYETQHPMQGRGLGQAETIKHVLGKDS